MSISKFGFAVVLTTGLMLLSACAPAATELPRPSATSLPTVYVGPTVPPAPTATLAPVATSTQAATAAPTVVANACVGCHTDKDTLIKNLKPADNKPKESEGVG